MWRETPNRVRFAVRLARRAKAPLSVVALRAEQAMAGGLAYRQRCRVADLSFYRDEEETLGNGFGAAQWHHAILRRHFGGDGRRRGEYARARLAEGLHERAIVELSD